MKLYKQVLIVILIAALGFSAFAQSAQRIEPVDVRSVGLGATYYTDTESVYSLFSNPASLAFIEDTTLSPGLSLLSGGDLFQAYDLVTMIQNGISTPVDKTDPAAAIAAYNTFFADMESFLGEDGYNASLRVGTPLTFGAIENSFGWGVANTIDIETKLNVNGDLVSFDVPQNLEDLNDLLAAGNTSIPSGFNPELTIPLVLTADVNLDAFVGYAVPLDLGILGELSIGVSARGLTQVTFLYQDDIQSLFLNENNFKPEELISQIPAAFSVGFGFDIGVQYQFLEMVNVALVWQDIFSPVWTNSLLSVSDFGSLFDDEGKGYTYDVLDSQLGIGASVDLPLEKLTGGVVSHAAAYVNYKDFLQLVRNAESNALFQDPLLDLAIGTEVVILDMLALRVGMNQLFPSGGIGLYLGDFALDFSVHNEELGYQGEKWQQLNFGLSFSFQQ